MGVVLGLDGGGSKTLLALAARTGEVVWLERGLGLDPMAGPVWKRRLAELLAASGAGDVEIDGAVFGLSCHGEAAEQDEDQRRTVADLAGPRALVDNDVRIAFDGAFAGGGGILLLSGTGSMAWASEGGEGGRHLRVGGWGEPFGDEGSAYWIGREALGLATRGLDGRAPQAAGFAAALLARLGLRAEEVFPWFAGLADRRAGIAALAFHVGAQADGGEPEAVRLIEAAAGHLANHAKAAAAELGAERALPWSHAGGVFANSLFRRAVAARIGTEPAPPRLPPVGGAVLRAAIRAGWTVDDAFLQRLAASLAHRTSP